MSKQGATLQAPEVLKSEKSTTNPPLIHLRCLLPQMRVTFSRIPTS